jgi:hypothetical protein
MSGGHFDYSQYKIEEIAEDIEYLIDHNISGYLDEDGNKQDRFTKETIDEFQKAVDILRKTFVYVHRIDWLVSADDGEDTFHERLKEDLDKLTNENKTS